MPAAPVVHVWPLPYEAKLDRREAGAIDLVVIHCTELPDLPAAREVGERVLYPSGTGNSGHYYVDRDGSVHGFVDPARVAHHVVGWNHRSIGIELVNRGRWPDWLDSRRQVMDEAYPSAQIEALLGLIGLLRAQWPSLRYIAGHEDLDTTETPASDDASLAVRRKCDPGPMFPWARLDAAGLQRLRP
jgi:N-acetylmuramoyl-L-alanine amidase